MYKQNSQQQKRPFQMSEIPFPKQLLTHWDPHRPLFLEIGAGVGLHPLAFAQQHPEYQIIAIEKTSEKYRKMQRRFLNHSQLTNLSIAHANAINYVSHYIPDKSLDGVFLLYPNPNPKNLSQRWARMPFINTLSAKLKYKARLTLATNEEWYAQEAEEHFPLPLLKKQTFTQKTLPFPPRTHFEKKYLSSGQNCYDLVFERSSAD